VDSLSPDEQQAFNALGSEHQREGFLIVRDFAGAAAHNGEKDFAISRASLADRLSITPPGAADVIRKLCELKIIAQTQPYVRHKKSARFRWLLARRTRCNAAVFVDTHARARRQHLLQRSTLSGIRSAIIQVFKNSFPNLNRQPLTSSLS
jgi:hypothetical protein